MNPTPTESYLAAEVLTAPPHKLQLMLLDAAIRAVQRAQGHRRHGEEAPASECVLRAQQIVGQLLAALDHQSKSDLVKKVAGVYLFVYRQLMETAFQHNEEKLEAALKILKTERDTWQQVSEKLGGAPSTPPPETALPAVDVPSDPPPAGLSLEA